MNKKTPGTRPRKSVSSATLTTIKSVQKRGNGSKSRQYKQAEKALRESEEKFRNLFEYAKDAIILADTQTGLILDVNTAGCKLLGLPKKKIIGIHQSEIHPPELAEKYKKVFKGHVEKGVVNNEYMIIQRADGKQIPVDISTSLITTGDKTIIQGIFRDVSERLKMEKALRESEEKISKAFRSIPEAVSIATLKDGVFLEANDSFISLNGYSRDEIIGHTGKELDIWVNPEDRYRMKQLIDKRGHFENEEFLLRRKGGDNRTVLLSADIITYEGKSCILTIGTDITERKKMEQALQESEEKFSTAFHTMPEAVALSRLKDGVFTDVNESFCRANECTREDIIGHPGGVSKNWANPEQRDQIMKILKEKGRVENVEVEFKKKSGEMHTALFSSDIVNIGGEPYIISISSDITERKMMEQALKESEEKFSKAFHAIPETLSISTLKEGKFLDVNDSFLKLNRLTREEVIGRTGAEIHLIKPGDERNKLSEILKEQGQFTNVEIEFKAPKSNNVLTFLFSADTIEINGEPCLLFIGNDITKRKQAENELQQALADLQQNSALLKATNKELESFSYSVSHDLRSPLRSIDGFSQALLEDYTGSLDEKAQDYLNRLRSASQKMGELIDGLLKLSRLTRSEMHYEKVDLSSLAN
jgi:PAS domain S-box-containing protein